jgi:cation diffusion facilitator family transporter
MHTETLAAWQHTHDFAVLHEKGERRTRQVLLVTAITMIVEIAAGTVFGSMALLADGWHMGPHVAAFLITIFAYRYARRHEQNPQFTFGTGKVGVLGGFASAVALAVVALVMSVESLERILHPQAIHFNEAIAVAVLGLSVNVICAFLLQGSGEHHHHRDHHDDASHEHHHHDHNLKAAYLHVLADALTSLLAIVALFSGKLFGWNWLDPVMGIGGAAVITRWSYGLLRETGPILLDSSIGEEQKTDIVARIEADADNRISDLHIWRVGPDAYAAIVSLVTHFPQSRDHYIDLLKNIEKLSHITIEVHHCAEEPRVIPTTQTGKP